MKKNKHKDKTNKILHSKIWWMIFAIFFPIVGLILFLVWRKSDKEASVWSGLGALIGIIPWVIILSFLFVLMSSTVRYRGINSLDTMNKKCEMTYGVEYYAETKMYEVSIDNCKPQEFVMYHPYKSFQYSYYCCKK